MSDQPVPSTSPEPFSTAWFDAEIVAQSQVLAECIRQQARLEGAIQALQYLRTEAAKLEAPTPGESEQEDNPA